MQFVGIFSSKSFVVGSELLTLFCQKQPERIAHGRSLIWAILSKRAKNEIPTLLKTKTDILTFSEHFSDLYYN